MGDEEDCNTGLGLGLGVGQYTTVAVRQKGLKDNKPSCLDLTFTLRHKEEKTAAGAAVFEVDDDRNKLVICSSLKTSGVEEEEEDDGNKTGESNNHNSSRKKLRLTKEQTNLLEDSFKLHTTLNSSQKQSMAKQLNLKPRQVEVWFQNRRARTKLKQTEVDCEFLKKCCESLTNENKRLKKELQELQYLKAAAAAAGAGGGGGGGASPLFVQLQKATNCCPSCKEIMIKSNSEGKTAAVIDVVLKNNKWQSGFHNTN